MFLHLIFLFSYLPNRDHIYSFSHTIKLTIELMFNVVMDGKNEKWSIYGPM